MWFNVYVIVMALLYGIICVVAIALIVSPQTFAPEGTDSDAIAGAMLNATVMLVVCAPLTILFGIAPLLSRRPWVWIYDLVLICLGLTSVCCMPATIPLLIFWIKPEARAWFGRSV
jgi:hypothetical protein